MNIVSKLRNLSDSNKMSLWTASFFSCGLLVMLLKTLTIFHANSIFINTTLGLTIFAGLATIVSIFNLK